MTEAEKPKRKSRMDAEEAAVAAARKKVQQYKVTLELAQRNPDNALDFLAFLERKEHKN